MGVKLIVSSFVHLGRIINSELNDQEDILHKHCTFIGQVNNVLCYFPRLAAAVRYKLFKSYCSSIYGCELWHLNNTNIDTFCTAWRTGSRRVWNLRNGITLTISRTEYSVASVCRQAINTQCCENDRRILGLAVSKHYSEISLSVMMMVWI